MLRLDVPDVVPYNYRKQWDGTSSRLSTVNMQQCAPTLPCGPTRRLRFAISSTLILSTLFLLFASFVYGQVHAAELILARELQQRPAAAAQKVAFLPPSEIAKQAPDLDGRLFDECWRSAVFVDVGSDMAGGTVTRATTVRIIRDAHALYFGFQCREPTLSEMPPSAPSEHDVWPEENVQIMLRTGEANDDLMVFAVGMNGSKYEWSLREGLAWSCPWEVQTTRSSTTWNAEIRIPLASLGVRNVAEGDLWGMNLARDSVASGEECGWAATDGNRRNPLKWGRLYFGDVDAYRKIETPPQVFISPERWVIAEDDSAFRVVVSVEPGSAELAGARMRLVVNSKANGASPAQSQMLALTGERVSLLFNVAMLPRGDFTLRAELLGKEDQPLRSAQIALRKEAATAQPAVSIARLALDVPKVPAKTKTARTWPIHTGVALPRGALISPENIRMLDPNGKEISCQGIVRARDPSDGSIRWLGLDFQADLLRESSGPYTLEYGEDVTSSPFKGFVRDEKHLPLDVSADKWAVNTGPLFFAVNFQDFSGITEAWMDVDKNGHYDWTEQIVNATRGNAGPYAINNGGWVYRLLADPECKVELEEWDELRLVIRGEGRLVLDRAASRAAGAEASDEGAAPDLGRCTVRITAYAGLPFVRMQYRFIFNKRAVLNPLSDLGVSQKLDFGRRGYDAVFGVPGGFRNPIQQTGPVSLLRLRPGEFLIQNHSEDGQAVSVKGNGGGSWACAAGSNRGFAACLRDMGQLFPKEIELGRRGEFDIHFWPRNGTESQRALYQEVNRQSIGALGFAHSGSQLDLTVPPVFSKGLPDQQGLADFDAVENMHLSDPTGIAPSYDVLCIFYPGEFPQEEIAEISRLFDMRLHAVQDSESLKASGILSGLLPVQRSARATAVARRLIALEKRNPQTGDFNYQDFHSRWLRDEGRWALEDHWIGTRGDLPGALWLMYLQTGDRTLLQAAERNIRHVMAFDFCNAASPEQEGLPDPRRRNIAGAFGNMHTPVHWQSTCHVNDRFARVRGMMLAYYLTGDSFARDAATLWGEAAKTLAVPNHGEDGAAYIANLSEVLALRYDPALLEQLGRCADYLFDMPFDPGDYDASIHCLREYAKHRSDPRVNALLQAAGADGPTLLQKAVETFDQNADAFVAGDSTDQNEITWQDFCQYVYGAVEGD